MSLTCEDLGFQPIEDKVVLLTGARSGMGRATALLLAKGGACLALLARRKQRLESLAAELPGGSAGEPLLIVADVRQEQECNDAVESCLRLQLNQLHDQGIHIRVVDVLPGATNSEYWGDRQVPRDSFMTSEEMASVILQTVATKGTVLVKKVQVEQFRFSN